MNAISNAEAALLGLLSEEAMHPYRLEQEVKFRDMRSWTELSMSSIYKLLRKLEKEGLVDLTTKVSKENRLQKLYAVSAQGRNALEQKLESILCASEHVKWQIDIATYNIDILTVKKAREALKKYRKDLQDKIVGYKNLYAFLRDAKCPKHRFAVALRPIFLWEAEIKWVDSFLEGLKK
jgi:DNA-binding PadR family transcriptional regulator